MIPPLGTPERTIADVSLRPAALLARAAPRPPAAAAAAAGSAARAAGLNRGDRLRYAMTPLSRSEGDPMRPLLIAGLLLAGPAAPAGWRRTPGVAQRVDRLEKEMRAVQRKVFPGGSQQYLEPRDRAAPRPPRTGGAPASAPVADLTARVDSLEQELARLTGQIEQNGFKHPPARRAVRRFKADADFRLNALEGNGPGRRLGSGAAPAAPAAAAVPSAATRRSRVASPRRPAEPRAGAPAAAVEAARDRRSGRGRLSRRLSPVGAEEICRGGSRAEGGGRKYPKHRRASYAQNLLGRAYLDDGKPAHAPRRSTPITRRCRAASARPTASIISASR